MPALVPLPFYLRVGDQPEVCVGQITFTTEARDGELLVTPVLDTDRFAEELHRQVEAAVTS
ncbi:hypothetical protein ACFC58_36290 [Kitasatospora purpeofusca]|uniref:hypothetical protein n=1 Tax=Kitasatospora purpeofusca TaxID=67352 RepID=UPI0035D9E101